MSIVKEFDTVAFFRKVKQKIAKDTKDMTFVEFKEYLSKRSIGLVKQDDKDPQT